MKKRNVLKNFVFLMLAITMMFPMGIGASDDVNQEIKETIITGEENIREYLSSRGESYDPDLIEVRTYDYEESPKEEPQISPYIINREYYIKNKQVNTYSGGTLLREYLRPAGTITVSEGIEISNSASFSGGISYKILNAQLGFNTTASRNFDITWKNTYSYPVRIKVYPRYERTVGEIWDKDLIFDDFVGKFTVLRAVGTDLRVSRQ